MGGNDHFPLHSVRGEIGENFRVPPQPRTSMDMPGPPLTDNLLRNHRFLRLLAFARPAEHWSGARRPFGARGAVPGRAIKTEESLDSVAACGNAGLERIKKFQFSVFSFKVKVDALRAHLA